MYSILHFKKQGGIFIHVPAIIKLWELNDFSHAGQYFRQRVEKFKMVEIFEELLKLKNSEPQHR